VRSGLAENRQGDRMLIQTAPSRHRIAHGLFSDLFNVAASRPAQITTEYHVI
jgi:hypothetical protein